jgi:hypothetical protein
MNRALIESALVYTGGTHTFEDVVESVEKGEAQYWAGPTSCIVTTIDEQPRQRILHFFLAAGNQVELDAMVPGIIEWGKEEGCVKARMVGRKGWVKSFLPKTGWTELGHVIMEKPL